MKAPVGGVSLTFAFMTQSTAQSLWPWGAVSRRCIVTSISADHVHAVEKGRSPALVLTNTLVLPTGQSSCTSSSSSSGMGRLATCISALPCPALPCLVDSAEWPRAVQTGSTCDSAAARGPCSEWPLTAQGVSEGSFWTILSLWQTLCRACRLHSREYSSGPLCSQSGRYCRLLWCSCCKQG